MLLNIFYIAIALLALSFCIFIHELGHFIAAKKRGLIADRFSIGFGPRLFGWKWRGTDFRISLLPLGGYVSLPQLADMGRLEGGEEDESEDLPPISYADKMIVAVMGAVFNIILAFCLSLILWGVGRDIIKTTVVDVAPEQIVNSAGEIVPGPAFEAGLLAGDTILEIDDERIGDWMQLQNAVMTGTGRNDAGIPTTEVTVLRGDKELTLTAHPVLVTSEDIHPRRTTWYRSRRQHGAREYARVRSRHVAWRPTYCPQWRADYLRSLSECLSEKSSRRQHRGHPPT